MRLEITVDVDLHRSVPDANDDVVPVSLIPVSVCGKRAPFAPSPEDLVLDAFFRHGQVELLDAATARREDSPVLARSAHAVAGKDRSRGELREFGDVVIRQVRGGKLDERGGGGRECEDLCGGENGVMLCEGSNVDAGSRRELESGLGAAGSGGEIGGGGETLVAVEEDLGARTGGRDGKRVPGAVRDGGGVFHVQGEGHRVC